MGWIGSFLSGRLSESCPRREIIFVSFSSFRRSTGLSFGPCSFSHLYKWCPRIRLKQHCQALRWWYPMYLTIHNSSDCTKLQEDLNNPERCESNWQMTFHPEKYEVMYFTTKKIPVQHNYILHGHTLSSVPQIKHLGVHISQDLHTSTSSPQRQIRLYVSWNAA